MGGHAARDDWEDIGLVKLLGGFLLAPFAWLLDLQVSYAAVKWACAADHREVLYLFPLGSLSLIALATRMSWSCWRMVRGHANEKGASMEDRSYFLAIAGLAMNAVFALLIVTSAFARYYLSPCE
jgi:hypothetical protein